MPRAGWNSLPRPARSASNPEVKAGLPRMALPFVGCREASSSLVYFAAQSAKNKETPSDRMVFLFGMPRAGWNSLPRPARINGRTAAGFRVGRPALRPPPFIAGAFVCRAANRSVGDGVPDVPSARRCRAGNGFPRRFAPRSKCPWGTPRNDRSVGLSTRCHHPTGWCFFSYSARRNSGFRSRRPSNAAAICPSRASRSPLRVPFSVR